MIFRPNTEKGQGLVEYALILVLISVAVIGLMTALGTQVGTVFQNVTGQLGGGGGGGA